MLLVYSMKAAAPFMMQIHKEARSPIVYLI